MAKPRNNILVGRVAGLSNVRPVPYCTRLRVSVPVATGIAARSVVGCVVAPDRVLISLLMPQNYSKKKAKKGRVKMLLISCVCSEYGGATNQ